MTKSKRGSCRRPPFFLICLLAAGFPAPQAVAATSDLDAREHRTLRVPSFLEANRLVPDAPLPPPAAEPSPEARLAAERLREAGPWRIDWDAEKGTPIVLSGGAAGPYSGAPDAAARAFLREFGDLFNVAPGTELRRPETVSSRTGTRVSFVQHHRGLPVYRGVITILVDDDGWVRMASGGFHPLPASTPTLGVPSDRAMLGVLRRLEDGAELAREVSPGLPASGIPAEAVLEYGPSDALPAGLMAVGRTRPAWFPVDGGFRIAWIVDVALGTSPRELRVFWDGQRDEPLYAEMLSADNHETIRVYTSNPDRTGLTDEPIADVDKPVTGGQLNGAFTNVTNDQAARIADAPYNHSTDPNDPTVDLNFDEQNVFYHNNVIRQFFRDLNGGPSIGSLNLDTNKLNSTVHLVDGGNPDADNAFFSPTFDQTAFGHGSFHTGAFLGLRDFALDEGVVYHEYSHRVHANTAGYGGAIYGGAMNEGTADYWPATFTDDRYLGEFANPDPEVGEESGWIGFHGFTRSMANARTYSDVCDNPFTTDGCEVHSDGEIWAGLLWDLRKALIAALGRGQGIAVADALILEHLSNMTGGGPFDTDDFIEARGALLTADASLFAGAYECVIWQAFAGREVGDGATVGNPPASPPVTSAALPAACAGAATVSFSRSFYNCSDPDSGTITVTDPDGGAVTTITVTTDSGDSESFGLTWGAGQGTTPAFDVRVVPPTPGNGVVEVSAEGERILASYADDSPVKATTGSSLVECTPEVRFVSSRLFNGSCNEIDDPFLDAGEAALLEVELELTLPVPGTGFGGFTPSDFTLTLVPDNPGVTVVGPGTVMPSLSQPIDELLRLHATFALEGGGGLTAGEAVGYTVVLGGPGITGAAAPIAFGATLEQDLSYVPQVVSTDFVSNAGGFTTEQNGASGTETWFYQTSFCLLPPDPGYWHQGANNCGNYDINDNSWLVSPYIRFQDADAEYPNRLTELRFQHLVSFNADAGAAPFIEGDLLYLGLANLPQLPAFYDETDNEVGFKQEIIDLTSLPGSLDLSHGWVRFRWLFIANNTGLGGAVNRAGWYIDQVEVHYEEATVVSDGNTLVDCTPVAALALETVSASDPAPGQGNGDDVIDPGEIITVQVSLENVGTGNATGIVGNLTSDRPDIITILDGAASFPDTLPLEMGASDAPHFTFVVDPAAVCDTTVNFTLTLDHNGAVGASVVMFPLTIGTFPTLFGDDFETDTGVWTVNPGGTDTATTGQWERVDPTRNCYEDNCAINNETQPGDDFSPGTGTGTCFITQDGVAPFNLHDIDGGHTTLETSDFDLSGATDPTVSFARWVYNRDGDALDAFVAEVSNDGGSSWSVLESVSAANGIPLPPVTNVWVENTFLLSNYFALPLSTNVRFRFTAQDQLPGQIVEAALDGFKIGEAAPLCNVFSPPSPLEVSPPGAAVPFTVDRSGGSLDLAWETTVGAVSYRIVTGDLTTLGASGGVTAGNASPLSCGVAGTGTSIAEPAGSVFLLVAGEGTGGTGPLGNATGGVPRAASTTCP